MYSLIVCGTVGLVGTARLHIAVYGWREVHEQKFSG